VRARVERTPSRAPAAVALIGAGAAHAAPGWHGAQRASDTSPIPLVYVSGDGAAARLTVRATRGSLVEITPYVSCHNADYSRGVSRQLATTKHRSRGLGVAVRRTFGPTFAGADSCMFTATVTGDTGTLRASAIRAVLEVRP